MNLKTAGAFLILLTGLLVVVPLTTTHLQDFLDHDLTPLQSPTNLLPSD
jgi:hypothetical protein